MYARAGVIAKFRWSKHLTSTAPACGCLQELHVEPFNVHIRVHAGSSRSRPVGQPGTQNEICHLLSFSQYTSCLPVSARPRGLPPRATGASPEAPASRLLAGAPCAAAPASAALLALWSLAAAAPAVPTPPPPSSMPPGAPAASTPVTAAGDGAAATSFPVPSTGRSAGPFACRALPPAALRPRRPAAAAAGVPSPPFGDSVAADPTAASASLPLPLLSVSPVAPAATGAFFGGRPRRRWAWGASAAAAAEAAAAAAGAPPSPSSPVWPLGCVAPSCTPPVARRRPRPFLLAPAPVASSPGVLSASLAAPAAAPFLAAATVTRPRPDAALPNCVLQQHAGPLLAAAERTVLATLLLLLLQLVDAQWHERQLCASNSVGFGGFSPRAGWRSVAAEGLPPQQAGCPTLGRIGR